MISELYFNKKGKVSFAYYKSITCIIMTFLRKNNIDNTWYINIVMIKLVVYDSFEVDSYNYVYSFKIL